MFVSIFLLSFYLLASNAQVTASDSSPMTDESCYTSGLWTTWFDVNATQNAYLAVVKVANQSCQSPLGADFSVYEDRSLNANTPETFSAWTEFLAALSRISNRLNGRDFTVRFCCVVNSTDGKIVSGTTATKASATTSKTTTTTAKKTSVTTAKTTTITVKKTSATTAKTTKTTTVAKNTTLTSLDGSTCGKQAITPESTLTSRIFGGTEAIAHSWPWMVIFYQLTKCTTSTSGICYTVCGGTIISNNYVITAAHCVNASAVSDITLIAGLHQQSSTNETNARQVRSVSNAHIHPDYETVKYSNDIALLQVSTPFEYTTYVQPACLPVTDPAAEDEVIIVGWGTDKSGGHVSDVLKQAYTTVVGDCTLYWPQVDDSLQICVANSDSGDSACQGDSGGPILALNNNQYIVAGVTSYGYTCRTAGTNALPNVYTRVSSYETWIKSIAT